MTTLTIDALHEIMPEYGATAIASEEAPTRAAKVAFHSEEAPTRAAKVAFHHEER